MVVRIIFGAALLALLPSPVLAAPASDRDWDECEDNRDRSTADRSIAACSRILDGNETPQHRAMAYVNRCGAWSAKLNYDRAIADCDEAVRLARRYTPAYINRGIARHGKGEIDGAIADYTEAIRLDPKGHGAYLMRGLSWSAKGDLDRAIADYNEVIHRGADLDLAYFNRGSAWRRKGDFDRAIADYSEAMWLDQTYFLSRLERGHAWSAKGDIGRAIADYTDAIRLHPNFTDSYTHRGYSYFSRLDFAAAAADLSRSVKSTGDPNAMLFHYLARARAGESALGELEVNAARVTTKAWPYPAIEFFLGRRSPDATLSAAPFGQRCAAEFFIGQSHLLRGERQQARSRFLSTVDGCPAVSVEHRAAAAELKAVGP